jgi:hypothetical protein
LRVSNADLSESHQGRFRGAAASLSMKGRSS